MEEELDKIEKEKNQLKFSLEKLKTHHNIEKDKFQLEIEEKVEIIDKMKKNVDKLIDENEKLRTNLRNLKKASFGNSMLGI